jgi:hypothetical protein
MSLVELTDGGGGWERSQIQIIRRRESLVLYKSFNILSASTVYSTVLSQTIAHIQLDCHPNMLVLHIYRMYLYSVAEMVIQYRTNRVGLLVLAFC